MMLAQHGANVIKVEPRGEGDWSRTLGTRHGHHTPMSMVCNIGKRSISLDLQSDAGRSVLWKLLEGADIFMEAFRPGVIKRLGFSYDAIRQREKRLLYLSVCGFGQKGPLSERPSMDPVLQAYTGMMHQNRMDDDTPQRIPFIAVDVATGLYAFQALSAALYGRRDEDHGAYFDVNLMQSAAAFQAVSIVTMDLDAPVRQPGSLTAGIHPTLDGWIQIAPAMNRDWIKMCEVLGIPEVAQLPQFETPKLRNENSTEMYAIIRPLIAKYTTQQLSKLLTDARLMNSSVNSYAQFMAEPQVQEMSTIQWLEQPGVPKPVPVSIVPGIPPRASGEPKGLSPTRGQHTTEVLKENGYTAAQIEDLIAKGVVGG
jgi:crotonobetainyl-CoA:carnitine CoA-transferase CaiB-like acyl-CoA transferase